MSLAIKDTATVPPENWQYHVAATNFTVSTKNYAILYGLVRDHCQANSVPVPSPQDVIDQMCANLHISCYDTETREPLINKMGLPFVAPQTSCCTKIPIAPVNDESI